MKIKNVDERGIPGSERLHGLTIETDDGLVLHLSAAADGGGLEVLMSKPFGGGLVVHPRAANVVWLKSDWQPS